VVANTADDLWVSGNLVSPDLDTVVYTLAGMMDRSRWWGIDGDTFVTSKFLEQLGQKEVMALGEKDRAVHIFRSERIRRGETLTRATDDLCQALGVKQKVVPMTDDSVATMIDTPKGEMHLQNYWVEHGGKLEAKAVRFQGIENARPCPGFLKALLWNENEPVLIGPSNPVTSIGPILELDGVRDILKKKRVVAISPLAGDKPFSGPAAEFMRAWGRPVSDQGVADLLGCVDLMVVSPDSSYEGRSVKMDTFMKSKEDSIRLAEAMLELMEETI